MEKKTGKCKKYGTQWIPKSVGYPICQDEKTMIVKELTGANELLRSVYQIVKRKGLRTNWVALEKKLLKELKREHTIMFPKNTK